jgi:hypothetical protein
VTGDKGVSNDGRHMATAGHLLNRVAAIATTSVAFADERAVTCAFAVCRESNRRLSVHAVHEYACREYAGREYAGREYAGREYALCASVSSVLLCVLVSIALTTWT